MNASTSVKGICADWLVQNIAIEAGHFKIYFSKLNTSIYLKKNF